MSKIKSITISNLNEVNIEAIQKRITSETADILISKLSPKEIDLLIEKLEIA